MDDSQKPEITNPESPENSEDNIHSLEENPENEIIKAKQQRVNYFEGKVELKNKKK